MKRLTLLLPVFIATSLFAENVVQYSSYVGLLKRLFDGFVTFDKVLSLGNHGIGTTDKLNGELIILDGKAYRVNFEGEVEEVAHHETTPYVTLANVDPAKAFKITIPAGTSYDQLDEQLSELAPEEFQENYPYAIRIEGTLTQAKLRSIPKLEKPYITLTEVAANQNVFEFENEGFTLIGFWNPSYADAFNPPQWHIHGLNTERTTGGHVLSFIADQNVEVQLWKLTGFDIRLPDTNEFSQADFEQDLSKEVQKINRDK